MVDNVEQLAERASSPPGTNHLLISAMLAHAVDAAPHEACGLITRDRVVRCDNVAKFSNHNFLIAPRDIHRVINSGVPLLGFYHSHIAAPAAPSPGDLHAAHWLGYLYAIISVIRGAAVDIRLYRLDGSSEASKQFVRVELDSLREPRA